MAFIGSDSGIDIESDCPIGLRCECCNGISIDLSPAVILAYTESKLVPPSFSFK